MKRVFLSYRRSDSSGHTGRIYDGLEAVLGREAVFKDLETIARGENFVQAVRRGITAAEVVLVVIGPRWTEPQPGADQGRLFDPTDTVRLEVREALVSDARVIPVLVGGAPFPTAEQIPEELHPLLQLNALEISDSRWDTDMERLLGDVTGEPAGTAVRRLLQGRKPPVEPLPFVAALLLAGLLFVRLGDLANAVAVAAAALLALFGLYRIRRRKSRGALFAWIALLVSAVYAAALIAAAI